MYVWIERELVLNLSLLVAVTGAEAPSRESSAGEESSPRAYIHLVDGRVVGVRATRETVVRKIREAHK